MSSNRLSPEQIDAAIRSALVSAVRYPIITNIARSLVTLNQQDALSSTFELGMRNGTFNLSLYLKNLEALGEEHIILKLLPMLYELEGSTGLQHIEIVLYSNVWFGFLQVLLLLDGICVRNCSQPFSTKLFDDDSKVGWLCGALSFFHRRLEATEEVLLLESVPDVVSNDVTKLAGISKHDQVLAMNQSKSIIYRLAMKLMTGGPGESGDNSNKGILILENYTSLADRYLNEVAPNEIMRLLDLLVDEKGGVEEGYRLGTEIDMRCFSGQITRQALALLSNPAVPIYLPCKVIEFKDYISSYRDTKWTETFKKRLRRARAEQEKQRSAPEMLRLTEFILPVNDIDD